MSKYKICGVGHALVDMEFEVSADFLQKLAIDKGVMTLIDEERQKEVLGSLADSSAKKISGGSAANTIVAASQLGAKCFYSCKVAGDDTGAFYIEDLTRSGVDSNFYNKNRPDGVTGKCLVLVTPDADRTMNTYLGISETVSTDELVPEAIADSEYIYTEGYLVTSPSSKAAAIKALELAREAGVKTSFSLSDPNMVQFFKEGLLEIIGPGVDFLFANDAEAMKMADTEDLTAAVEGLKQLAKSFAITRGAEGALIFDGNEIIEIAPNPVKAIDTVGAGDMFAGAFLYGITNGMSFSKAGDLASLASSRVVTIYGPRMAPEETQSLLKEFLA